MLNCVYVSLAVTVLVAWYIWRKKKFSYFAKMGVPGPEPSLIFGHLLEIKRRGATACFGEWIRKYGSICGFYNGAIPFLLVADVDLLKKVELEDSAAFMERGNVFEIEPLPDYRHKMIVTAPVSRWREMRAVLSPAFTMSKLSQIFVIMDKCSDTMMEKLEEKRRTTTSVEVTSTFRRATIDTMFKAGYGVDFKVQDSPPGGFFDELGKGADQLLRSVPLCDCFPEFYHFWYLLSWLTSRLVMPYFKLTTLLISPILNERKTLNLREKADVLQLLLNKESRGQLSLSEGHGFDGKTKLALTKDEVAANSAFYLIAGMEATPNTMGMTLHLVARHPEVQDKLRAEVLRVLKRDGKFTQRNVSGMTYLDMVLNESMRFYPGVVGFVSRRPARDYEFNGMKIPRGLSVMAAVSCIHQDPELWPEPDKFDPERFNAENKPSIHPISFQPFGKGPRDCLGRNFALLEMKLILSKVLARFKLSVDEEHHKNGLQLGSAFIASFVPNGVWMKLDKPEE
ncbi:hypothetical protein MTO96_018637 [Rhipicephalus appendiculatus]